MRRHRYLCSQLYALMLSGSTWIHADGEVQCPIDPPVGRYFARRLMDGSLASKTGPPVGHPDLQSEEGCKARMHPQAGAWTGQWRELEQGWDQGPGPAKREIAPR